MTRPASGFINFVDEAEFPDRRILDSSIKELSWLKSQNVIIRLISASVFTAFAVSRT
jgi:hypothetical protein